MSQAIEKQEQRLLNKAAQNELISEVYKSEGLKTPPLKENRKIAKAALAVVVALCILVIGPMKLNARHNKVISEFKSGTEKNYVESVYNYIQQSAESAGQMLSKMEADTVSESVKSEINDLINSIKTENDENKLIELYDRLNQKATQAFEEYKSKIGFNTGDTMYDTVKRSYDNVNLDRQINNLSYWSDAGSYNKARGGFPASLFGSIFGIEYAPAK